jgi:hypothetical protein
MKDKSFINQNMIQMWQARNLPDPLDKMHSMGYNELFKHLSWGLWTCPERYAVPTSYDIQPMHITATCHMRVSFLEIFR